MFDYSFEIIINLVQSVYLISFLFLFFDGKYKKKFNILYLIIVTGLHFCVLLYFTFNSPFVTLLDMGICLLIYIIYSVVFLRGQIAVKIIIPIVMSLIYTIISYGFVYFTSIITGQSFHQLGTQSSLFRYICVTLVNLTMITILIIVLKTKAKIYTLKTVSNIIAFICIPVLAMAIIYMTVYILIFTEYQQNIIPMLAFICVGMIVIASMVWFMISRINKDNQVKTELLLSEQRAELYKKSIENSNKQIEEITKLKHDMKNNISCIDALAISGEHKKIHDICKEKLKGLDSVGHLINTKNPVLNSVLNVEIEKARLNGISTKCQISNDLKYLVSDTDIISIIGNLFDNAIEYIVNNGIDDRSIVFTIESNENYFIVKCINKISFSVLNNNPMLVTDKEDKNNHGKGVLIIKEIAKKYGGDLIFTEKENNFIATVVLDDSTFPENR